MCALKIILGTTQCMFEIALLFKMQSSLLEIFNIHLVFSIHLLWFIKDMYPEGRWQKYSKAYYMLRL